MRLLGKLFLLGFGLLFVVIGLLVGVVGSRSATEAADRAEALAPLGAAALEDRPAGEVVLVEGTISPRNPPRFREFVAYRAEEYRGVDDDGDPDWEPFATVTPPLILDAGGVVLLANEDYSLEGDHARYEDPGPPTRGDFFRESTKRYQGLVAGGTVTVIGMVAPGQEGNELRAEFVYAGTRAEYIAGQRDAARNLPIIGLIFGGIGSVFVLIGLWVALRG
jgi:hypothetical protein